MMLYFELVEKRLSFCFDKFWSEFIVLFLFLYTMQSDMFFKLIN